MSKPIIWSNGGGTQSIAIAVLIHQGRLPKPDRVVMADTGFEFKKTWEYTEQYVKPMLAEVGLEIEIAPHSLAKVDLYSHKGEVLIPAFTQNAKLPTFCSSEWKTLVVRRYIGGFKANPDGVTMWLGMSLDEIHRLKHSTVDWVENHWPLCFDVKMTRGECRDLITSYGLPEPIKSRCKMCPHQPDDEWIEVKQEPEEWNEAVRIDKQIFASHQVRLHKSGLPLEEVQFAPKGKNSEGDLLEACDSGYCWT
jgi:hypothetical protein